MQLFLSDYYQQQNYIRGTCVIYESCVLLLHLHYADYCSTVRFVLIQSNFYLLIFLYNRNTHGTYGTYTFGSITSILYLISISCIQNQMVLQKRRVVRFQETSVAEDL
jgi:hypothetical protein